LVVGAGVEVEFDASGSSDANGITSYVWSFGDGHEDEGQKVSHVYMESGNYTATLEVTDVAGNNAQTEITITVEEQSNVVPEYPSAIIVVMLAVISVALALIKKVNKVNPQ